MGGSGSWKLIGLGLPITHKCILNNLIPPSTNRFVLSGDRSCGNRSMKRNSQILRTSDNYSNTLPRNFHDDFEIVTEKTLPPYRDL